LTAAAENPEERLVTEHAADEISPVTVMSYVLGVLAGTAVIAFLIASLYHASVASLTKQHEEYKDQVAKVYNASFIDITSNYNYRFGDIAVKLVIDGKPYNCLAPAKLDLRLGEALQCAPYEISSSGVVIRT
jgi:hypothetical protein